MSCAALNAIYTSNMYNMNSITHQAFSQHAIPHKTCNKQKTKWHVYVMSEHQRSVLNVLSCPLTLAACVSSVCLHCEPCSLAPFPHMSQTRRPLCVTAKLTHLHNCLHKLAHKRIAKPIQQTYIFWGLCGDCWKKISQACELLKRLTIIIRNAVGLMIRVPTIPAFI